MAGTKALSAKDMNSLKITNLADGSSDGDAVNKGQLDDTYTDAISRANHTGSQTASTISDFDTQVRTSTLNQMGAPTADLSINTHKLTNVVDPTSAQDAATKAYVDTSVASLTSGLVIKGSVVAAADSNVTLSSPGSTIDGVTASADDIFLLTGQTDPTENGPYVFNGSSTAMTRATNWDSDGEAVLGSFWIVQDGTYADQLAVLDNDSAVTLDTTQLSFTFITTGSGGGGAATGYTTTCPSVSAGATWTVTHNLGTRAVLAQVMRVASPYDIVDCYIARTTTNTLSVIPDVAMTEGEYEVMVQKVLT